MAHRSRSHSIPSRGDVGGVTRWVAGSSGLMSIRGSFSLDSQDRVFGDVRERGTRSTGFGEFSLQGMQSRHTWVVGGAYQYDGYNARDLPIFDYGFHTPAVFAQDEFGAGPVRVSLSGRIDFHSEYGTLASPRGSLLWRPDSAWSVRMSAGGGAFAPTPFVEDTDETGLSRVAPLEGLEAERAWGGSVDVTRRVGGLELTGTVFASDVRHPVQADRRDRRPVRVCQCWWSHSHGWRRGAGPLPVGTVPCGGHLRIRSVS